MPLSQSGAANAVSYSTFLAGLATLPAFDASPLHAMASTATTSRILAAHLSDTVAVEDFGAAGDGATDDSAAFSAAAGAGLPLRLGAKTYIVNGPVSLSSGTCLTLIGVPGQTTLRRLKQSGGVGWLTLTAPLIHAEGIIFDGNGLSGGGNAVTVAAGCLRSSFERCTFINALSAAGLSFSKSDPTFARHTVLGCEAYGNANGISCAAADGLTVTACHLHDNSIAGIYVDYIDPTHAVKSRLAAIVGNQCWNNQIGIVIGDYSTTYADPATIANQTADGELCIVASNICHDNTEYGIVAQGYNLLVHGNVVYRNGGANANNGGILANAWASSVTANVVSNHLGFGIDAGAANFTLIAGNLVTTSRIGINAGGAQEPRITGNSLIAASYYGIVIYNNETNAGGAPIGVPSVDVSITDNLIDMPLGGGGILLIDGPQKVQVSRNNFITAAGADLSLCLLPLTNSVTIEGNLLNGVSIVHFADPLISAAGPVSGLNTLLYPDMADAVSILSAGSPVQSIRSLNAGNYASYVTFLTLTAGGQRLFQRTHRHLQRGRRIGRKRHRLHHQRRRDRFPDERARLGIHLPADGHLERGRRFRRQRHGLHRRARAHEPAAARVLRRAGPVGGGGQLSGASHGLGRRHHHPGQFRYRLGRDEWRLVCEPVPADGLRGARTGWKRHAAQHRRRPPPASRGRRRSALAQRRPEHRLHNHGRGRSADGRGGSAARVGLPQPHRRGGQHLLDQADRHRRERLGRAGLIASSRTEASSTQTYKRTTTMIRRLALSAATTLALAGCAGSSATDTLATDTAAAAAGVAIAITYANTALSVAEAALAVYKATPKPNGAVIAEAQKLDAAARASITQYGPEATVAIAAVGALATYLLTSAPRQRQDAKLGAGRRLTPGPRFQNDARGSMTCRPSPVFRRPELCRPPTQSPSTRATAPMQ